MERRVNHRQDHFLLSPVAFRQSCSTHVLMKEEEDVSVDIVSPSIAFKKMNKNTN